MKIFYFGSVCANEIFNETVAQSRVKPSASAQSFESALMSGFSQFSDVQVTAISAESIAMYPGGNRLFLRKRMDQLTPCISTTILSAINLPGIKQINHAHGAARALKKWLRQNHKDANKCVLVYGLYPQVVDRLLKICNHHKCKIYAIITDVPSTMFTYTKSKNIVKRLFSKSFRKKAISLQDKFDGYIYLTKQMSEAVAPDKPYTVVEAIADTDIFSKIPSISKSQPPALMYAGALYKKYGLDLILDTFEQMESDCQLWLFGSGDYEEEIKKRSKNNPKIKFYGRVSRDEVLKKETEATVLLNIRNAEDEYTQYSFPSKMIEYMLSGTPLYTSKLSGVPDEYDNYCFITKQRDAKNMAQQLDAILQTEDLQAIGDHARRFVINEKNAQNQAKKITTFLKEHVHKG